MRPYGVVGRDRRGLVGHPGPAPTAAVDDEPAAQRDPLELTGARRGAERGDRARLGVLRREARRDPRRGLVHAEVRDGRRREVGDDVGELLAVARVDPAELAAAQPAARRHEVDADDLAHLGALLEQLRDPGAELAAHPGDEHPHQVGAPRPRRPGRLVARFVVVALGTQQREEDHLTNARDFRRAA